MNYQKRLERIEASVGAADDEPRYSLVDILMSLGDPDILRKPSQSPNGGHTLGEWDKLFRQCTLEEVQDD